MRLVCKPGVECHLAQRSAPRDLLARKLKSPPEQVAVGACPTQQAKLAGQIVAGEACHSFQLRGADDARLLGIEERAGPVERGDVEVPQEGDPRA
jgi:hypothetical protein